MAKSDADVQRALDRVDRLYMLLSEAFDGVPSSDIVQVCAMLLAHAILLNREGTGKTVDEYLEVFSDSVKLEMRNPLIAKSAGNA